MSKPDFINDIECRLYVSSNGQLRMVMENLGNSIVRSINVSDMYINGLSMTDDLKVYFTGHGGLGNFKNKVVFVD